MKSKGVKVTNWVFGNSIVVLFRFEGPLRDDSRIGDVVLNWPDGIVSKKRIPLDSSIQAASIIAAFASLPRKILTVKTSVIL